ncbi:MAG: pentapeptide repeat-containing protein [Methylosarcina sp.]
MNNNPLPDDELDPLYRAVFDDPQNGTPNDITQAGCLALARLGKEAWNAWRQKYQAKRTSKIEWGNKVNFSGFDFREESIDFQGFVFDHEAHFDGAQFGDHTHFDGAQFGNYTHFIGAQFGNYTHFEGAQFGASTHFEGAQFGDFTRFEGAQFGNRAHFDGAQFGNRASFDGAQFGNAAYFIGAQFDKRANFNGTQFGDYTHFEGTQFSDSASFKGAQFSDSAIFVSLTWASLTSWYSKRPGGLEAAKAWAEAQGLSPETFKSISFDGAKFAGQVDFSGRLFEGSTSFGRLRLPYLMKVRRHDPDGNVVEKVLPEGLPVVFSRAPLFHNCKLYQDTTFDGAKFPKPSTDPTENDTAARAYRTLKLAFAQQQATREEQRFFRLEMAEEAARAKNSQGWLFVVYKWVSDYGFSLSRPTLLWLGFMLPFLLIYSLLANLTQCFPWQADCHIRYDVLQFTLLQALPLPGLDKWSDSLRSCLFPKEGWSSVWVIVAVMFHKTISLLAVFLFGLALRNLFKMK